MSIKGAGANLGGDKDSTQHNTLQVKQQPHGQSGSPIIAQAYSGTKTKEDVFVKNNLEYEQRLKTHLYQFEDQPQQKNQSIDDSHSDRNSRAYARETPNENMGQTKMSNNP